MIAATCLACGATDGTEIVGTSSSELAVTGLFPTGEDASGARLGIGATDPHYILSSNDPNFPGPNAVTVTPIVTWVAAGANSRWISIRASTFGATGDTYTYRTTFTLSGVDPASATLTGQWACDDSCTLELNGTQVASNATPAWIATSTFTVPAGSPFRLGTNTLSFVVSNATGGPTGLQVLSISGTVSGCNADSQCSTSQFCNTQTATCVSKIANGSPIPTLTGHTPPLTGKCTSTVGTAVCVSGVCDADNDCGLANGDGPCTAANGSTVCRSGACSVDGTCEPAGGCNVDGDCTSSQTCDQTIHTCRTRVVDAGADGSADAGGVSDAGADAGAGADAEGGGGADAGADAGGSEDGSADAGVEGGPTEDAGQTADASGADSGQGADAGGGAEGGPTEDAGADGSVDAGTGANPGEDASAGEDAAASADASAGEGDATAGRGEGGRGEREDAGAAEQGGSLQGGGLSCGVSPTGTSRSGGAALWMLVLTFAAAAGRGRRKR